MSMFGNSMEQFSRSWQALSVRWTETSNLWADAAQRHFERDFWQPLEQQADSFQAALQELKEVTANARACCP